jgi:2-keto-4-pentenoate hydratase/2-oxohepta-3-ene-1,7-dioic acid hydratase in catechol pathway
MVQKMPQKIICIGRNYRAHATELNNAIPTVPVIFMKPSICAVPMANIIFIPHGLGEVHHEAEIYFSIKENINRGDKFNACDVIGRVGVALDLTLRDVQDTLKKQGLPWEKAKSFDASCPISESLLFEAQDLHSFEIKLFKNNTLVQHGLFRDIIFSLQDLLVEATKYFSLHSGDIILTGTPSGVGALHDGDTLTVQLFSQKGLLIENCCTVKAA